MSQSSSLAQTERHLVPRNQASMDDLTARAEVACSRQNLKARIVGFAFQTAAAEPEAEYGPRKKLRLQKQERNNSAHLQISMQHRKVCMANRGKGMNCGALFPKNLEPVLVRSKPRVYCPSCKAEYLARFGKICLFRIYGLPILMVRDPNYFEQELRECAFRYIEVFLKPEAKVLPPPVCTILASFLFSHAMIWDYASTSRVRLRMNRIRFEQLYEKVGSIVIPDDSIQHIYDDFFGDSSETEWLD